MNLNSFAAHIAQQMCVTEINQEQKSVAVLTGDYTSLTRYVRAAWSVTEKIGTLNLLPEMRTQYNSNRSALSGLRSNLGMNGSSSSSRNTSSSSSSGDAEIPAWLYVVGVVVVIWLFAQC